MSIIKPLARVLIYLFRVIALITIGILMAAIILLCTFIFVVEDIRFWPSLINAWAFEQEPSEVLLTKRKKNRVEFKGLFLPKSEFWPLVSNFIRTGV